MTISPVSTTCSSPAAQAQTQTHTHKNAAPAHQPEDTVQLSAKAVNRLKGADPDGDGD